MFHPPKLIARCHFSYHHMFTQKNPMAWSHQCVPFPNKRKQKHVPGRGISQLPMSPLPPGSKANKSVLLMEEIRLTSWYGQKIPLFTGLHTSRVVVWDFWTTNSKASYFFLGGGGGIRGRLGPLRFTWYYKFSCFHFFPQQNQGYESFLQAIWWVILQRSF